MNNLTNTINDKLHLKNGLYLIATPIGNLRDITLRALDIIASCDLVLCEDTRVTGKLLSHYEIKNKLVTYNDHSEHRQREKIFQQIKDGKSFALVSDAGMPLISDPGYKLVSEARKNDIYISSAPGANAPLTALQLSGLPTDSFTFIGFLPSKETARKKTFAQWKDIKSTLIAFETGPRLLSCLKDIISVLGNRTMSVTRELTKMYEEVKTDKVSTLIEYYEGNSTPKGEIVIVIDQGQDKTYTDEETAKMVSSAIKQMKVKDAASYVADLTGKPKKELYQIALDLKKNND